VEIKSENKKNQVILEMTFGKKEWNDGVDIAYKKNAGKYTVQGFRKGKAPRKMYEAQYGAGVFYEDAIHELFADNFSKYLDENKEVKLIDYPHLNPEFQKDGGIKLIITCDVEPEIKLGKYTGIEIKKTEINVGDKDVENYIAKMAEARAKQVAADKDYKLIKGDIAVIDFAGSVNGEYFEGGTAKNYELAIGSGSFIDNFEEQLIGLKIGDKKDVKVKFPDNYQTENLKGKPAKFEVTINNILRKELPEIDDEFAKEVSDFNTLKEYKDDIMKTLTANAEKQAKFKDEDKLFAVIADNATVDVPDIMVERNLDDFFNDLEQRLSRQGLTLDTYAGYYGTTAAEMRKKKWDSAKRAAKTRLVLNAIVDKEKLHTKKPEEQSAKIQEFLQKNNKFV
jgi:trigger factor